MLTIQNLRKNIHHYINSIPQNSYRNCAILICNFSIMAIIFLNMPAFFSISSHFLEHTQPHFTEYEWKEIGKNRDTIVCSNIKEKKENKRIPEGKFAVSCQSIVKIEQNKRKKKVQKESIAICASIEPMHNEVQQEPVNPYGDIFISDEDYEALLRIVQAEAGGEDEQGKILVAEVILNRVLAKDFASSVYDVIFERSGGSPQFAPTADGRYYSVEVTQKTAEAVEKALKEEDLSQGALFFSARSKANPYDMAWFDRNLKWLFQYGGHEFYTLP